MTGTVLSLLSLVSWNGHGIVIQPVTFWVVVHPGCHGLRSGHGCPTRRSVREYDPSWGGRSPKSGHSIWVRGHTGITTVLHLSRVTNRPEPAELEGRVGSLYVRPVSPETETHIGLGNDRCRRVPKPGWGGEVTGSFHLLSISERVCLRLPQIVVVWIERSLRLSLEFYFLYLWLFIVLLNENRKVYFFIFRLYYF